MYLVTHVSQHGMVSSTYSRSTRLICLGIRSAGFSQISQSLSRIKQLDLRREIRGSLSHSALQLSPFDEDSANTLSRRSQGQGTAGTGERRRGTGLWNTTSHCYLALALDNFPFKPPERSRCSLQVSGWSTATATSLLRAVSTDRGRSTPSETAAALQPECNSTELTAEIRNRMCGLPPRSYSPTLQDRSLRDQVQTLSCLILTWATM